MAVPSQDLLERQEGRIWFSSNSGEERMGGREGWFCGWSGTTLRARRWFFC